MNGVAGGGSGVAGMSLSSQHRPRSKLLMVLLHNGVQMFNDDIPLSLTFTVLVLEKSLASLCPPDPIKLFIIAHKRRGYMK